MRNRLAGAQNRRIHRQLRMNGGRTLSLALALHALGLDRRNDLQQRIPLLVIRKVASVVRWREPALVGEEPDLEEVNLFFGVAVVLGVADSGAGARHLDIAALHDFGIAHAVFAVIAKSKVRWGRKWIIRVNGYLLLKFAGNNVREYLHFTVRVGTEAFGGLNAVLVDHTQRTEALEFRVVVPV